MFKSYVTLFWKVLLRKKLFTMVTLMGICFPLTIITLAVSFVTHITIQNSPQSKFGKVVCLNEFHITKKANGSTNNMNMGIPYALYDQYLIKFKTPQLLSFTTRTNFEIITNSKKKNNEILIVDDKFWQIADFNLLEGNLFNKTDIEKAHNYAVIDVRTKEYYFGSGAAAGKQLSVFNKKYIVIGVVKNTDITKTYTHANIFIPITTYNNLKKQDFLEGNGRVLALLKNKNEKLKLENEIKKLSTFLNLKHLEGLQDISIDIQNDSFIQIIKDNIGKLFGIYPRNKFTIPISIGCLVLFFLILPAFNLIYINQSQFSDRIEEIGIRKSFGSSRIIIFKQFLIENTLITVIGGIISLIFTYIIILAINKSQLIDGFYIELNWQAFTFCALLWILLSFLSGALPSNKISKNSIIESLQNGNALSMVKGSKNIKRESVWLSIEITFVFISLFCITNFFVQLGIQLYTPIGFTVNSIYEVGITNNKVSWMNQDNENNAKLLDSIKLCSNVLDIARLDGCRPYAGDMEFNSDLHYKNLVLSEKKNHIKISTLGMNTLAFFNLKLIHGSWITPNDTLSETNPVVINKKLQMAIFGNKNAINEVFTIDKSKFMVKGVLESYKPNGEFSNEENNIFKPICTKFTGSFNCSTYRNIIGYLKFKNYNPSSIENLKSILHTKYPNYDININPISKYQDEYIKRTLIPLGLILLLCLSIFLIILFGMFGVMWYKINLRIPEIGLRKSVGASNHRIFRLILKDALKITAIGLIPGILIVIQLPLLKIFDFPTYVYILSIIISAVIVVTMVMLFTVLPGFKAIRVQPATALHEE